MKNSLVWVVLLGLAFGLASCKDDDPAPVDTLVGTWALANYTFTEMPPNFTEYEGEETNYLIGWELGYTILFNSDGTYSRAYIVDERYEQAQSIYDKGKWTREDVNVKLTPASTTDLNLIEKFGGTPGTNFKVVGDVTENSMKLSATVTVFVLPDDVGENPTVDDLKPIDATIIFSFNKL